MRLAFALLLALACAAATHGCKYFDDCGGVDLGVQAMFTRGGTEGDGYRASAPLQCQGWADVIAVTGTGRQHAGAAPDGGCAPAGDAGAPSCAGVTLYTLLTEIRNRVEATGAQVEDQGTGFACTVDGIGVSGVHLMIDSWRHANDAVVAVGEALHQLDSADTVFIRVGQNCPM